ncbi:MAG: hypothetical protein MO847_04585 [Candidatus Protistobacter heckmanni]|nr:hypothetical protein [Candidatus Protistobacter heckmanni]
MDAAVEIRDLSKQFGEKPALEQVSLRIAPGEMVALLGQLYGAEAQELFEPAPSAGGQDGGAPAIAAPDAHQATALPQALSQTLQQTAPQTAPQAAASSGAFAA